MQRTEELARALQMLVEEAGSSERGGEEWFCDAVCELVGDAGAAAECGGDGDGGVVPVAEGGKERGGGGVGCYYEVEWGEFGSRVGEDVGLGGGGQLVGWEKPFGGEAVGDVGEFAVADRLPLRLFDHWGKFGPIEIVFDLYGELVGVLYFRKHYTLPRPAPLLIATIATLQRRSCGC